MATNDDALTRAVKEYIDHWQAAIFGPPCGCTSCRVARAVEGYTLGVTIPSAMIDELKSTVARKKARWLCIAKWLGEIRWRIRPRV